MARLRKLRISLEFLLADFMVGLDVRYRVIKDGLPIDSKIEEVKLTKSEIELIISSEDFEDLPAGIVPPDITPVFQKVYPEN